MNLNGFISTAFKKNMYVVVLLFTMHCFYLLASSNKQQSNNCLSREHLHKLFNEINVVELINKYYGTSTFSSKSPYFTPKNHKIFVDYSLFYPSGYDGFSFIADSEYNSEIDSLLKKGISKRDILHSNSLGNLTVSYTGAKKSFDIKSDDKEQELVFFSIVNPWVEFIDGIRVGLSKKELVNKLGKCFVQKGDSIIAYHDGEHTLVEFFLLNDTINQIEYGKYNFNFVSDSIPEEYLKRDYIFWYSYKKYRIYPKANQK
jgi:hypothetical protein